MHENKSSKIALLKILEILKERSDEEHQLSTKQIGEILERDYLIKLDRNAVKRNLMRLEESGYRIDWGESTRVNKNGETETIPLLPCNTPQTPVEMRRENAVNHNIYRK